MKIHDSNQSTSTIPLKSQSGSRSNAGPSFTIPDDVSEQLPSKTSAVSSTGIPTSLSSFWLNSANDPKDGASGVDASGKSVEDQFKDLANMTPAEKIRAEYLARHHMTEAQFDALPSDEQKAINDEIAKEIQQQAKETAKKEAQKSGAGGDSLSVNLLLE